MPWLSIPEDRRTIFIEPPHPSGGLLGGSSSSGKISKLQALAAARKKKAEDRKLEIQKTQIPTNEVAPDLANELNQPPSVNKTSNLGNRAGVKAPPILIKSQNGIALDGSVEQPDSTPTDAISNLSISTEPHSEPATLAAPSAFAQTLLGSSMSWAVPVPRNQYPIPYMSFTSSVADAFSEPSPDDVVLTAQSKGSLLAK
ncbi:hypothetical protein RRF57_002065 [Xylaria bambusicola]|uniref:Uncharacterized protein n=1 Tax=Xylaria bambusicola TaxID=326684 RepID=A0AAN7U6E2_9PEZI